MNCVENLPVYMAIVLAQTAIGLHGVVIDSLSLAMFAARIGQTTVHIALRPTDASASLRFALFFVQLVCMITIGVATVAAMVS